jgi:DNA-binding LacI/PurR family transcriptional regulator
MSTRSFGRETKFQKVRAEVELLANRLGPDERLPSIRQLASSLDASINTLTGVLEELEARNIIYRRHGSGIFVSPSRAKSVWLICDSQFFSHGHSPFWDVLAEQVRLRANLNNERLSMHFTLPNGVPDAALHHTLIGEIQAGRVQGILGVGLPRSVARWILSQGVPFTAFAGWAPYVVNLDYRGMIEMGIEALAERGCRRIGFWKNGVAGQNSNEATPDSCSMTSLFREVMAERGLAVDEALIKNNWHLVLAGIHEQNVSQGYHTAREVFAGEGPRPEGIVIADDIMTQGALLAMAQLGVQPGRDVQIATHANKGTPIMLGDSDDLILLEFDPAELVSRLFRMLETLMGGGIPATTTVSHPDVEIEFIEPRLVLPTEVGWRS